MSNIKGREMTLDEVKRVQMGILKAIHNFCKSKGLRYSLGGGTLLGAVRHQGYIPWDDDIDIMLPRPDYDKLLESFEDENYAVQDYHSDKRFPLSWARIYSKKTVLVSNYAIGGVFVDVFPIDGLPTPDKIDEYMKEQRRYKKKLRSTTRIHSDALHKLKKQYSLHGNLFYYYLKYTVWKIIYPKRDVNVKEMDTFFHSYPFETSEYAGALVGTYGMKEYMKAEVFKSYIELPFEGNLFMCIKDYDAYLTQHYGDYMQLPPEDKRKTHHQFKEYWKD